MLRRHLDSKDLGELAGRLPSARLESCIRRLLKLYCAFGSVCGWAHPGYVSDTCRCLQSLVLDNWSVELFWQGPNLARLPLDTRLDIVAGAGTHSFFKHQWWVASLCRTICSAVCTPCLVGAGRALSSFRRSKTSQSGQNEAHISCWD